MVVTIEALLRDVGRRRFGVQPEADPLTEIDALQEADLVEVRIDVASSLVAVLFDLRQALQFRDVNTGVIVARGIDSVSWSGEGPQRLARLAHPVMASLPDHRDGRVGLIVECLRGARLAVTATSAEFFVGNVAGLPDAPPDFIDDDEVTIAAGMPTWSSLFTPVAATFLDPEN
jgi:hypothetical protein